MIGGVCQIVAGFIEARKGDRSTSVFTIYTIFGFQWLAIAIMTILAGTGTIDSPDNTSYGLNAFLFGCFNLAMFLASFKGTPLAYQTLIFFAFLGFWFNAFSLWS